MEKYTLIVDKIEPLAFIGKIFDGEKLLYETDIYTLEGLARSEIETIKNLFEQEDLDIN